MPLFIAALIGGLVQAAGSLVGRVLLSLGIGYVTSTGFNTAIDFARSEFISAVSGMPAVAVQLLGLFKIGVAVSMILSAITIKLTIQGLSAGGALRKMVQK